MSGPTPSSSTSKDGTGPWSSGPRGGGQFGRVRLGGGLGVVAVRAVGRRASGAPGPGPAGPLSSSASRAWVSLRSGSPSGRNRSSPHHRSSRDQSTASRAGASARAASRPLPLRPPVRTTEAEPRAAWASTIFVISRAAAALAISSLSRWTTTCGALTWRPPSWVAAFFAAAASAGALLAGRRALRRRAGVPGPGLPLVPSPSRSTPYFSATGVRSRPGRAGAAPRRSARRCPAA